MRNKKVLSITMAAVLAMAPMAAVGAEKLADAGTTEAVEEEMVKGEYFKTSGTVTYVNKDKNNMVTVGISEKAGNTIDDLVVHLDDSVVIVDSKTQKDVKRDIIKKGDKIEVFVRSNTPVTSSLPPQTTPQVVVLKTDDSFVEVDAFNKDLVNKANTLKLNIGEDTILENKKGEKITKEELANNELVVFYTVSTKSIPAQTTPIKVIALQDTEKAEITKKSVINIDGKDIKLGKNIIEKDGTYMIPLRQAVEELGYEVTWNQKTRSIEIVKGALWHKVAIGENTYNFAKMAIELEEAPVLEKGTTFVPLNFFEEVLGTTETVISDGVLHITSK